MNRKNLALLILLAALLAFVGCSSDDDPGTPEDEDYNFTSILADYTANVVVATYAEMATDCASLLAAVEAVENDPTQDHVDAACAAWVEARAPWEASEAFLFGPAGFMNLDPSVDSWPLDHQQLDDVLASSFELTPEFVADGLGPALRGYHTVEYLLFRDGMPRNVADITERERQYLVAATTVLSNDATLLHEAWAVGIDGGTPFKDEFDAAGTGGSRYSSQRAAVQELIEGAIAICDEVANGKIADPYDENDPGLVESQFSFNSLRDFQNNIRSVQNAYLGTYGGVPGTAHGLTDFVAEKNADLDTRLKGEIEAAIAAIAAIPEPFRNNLNASTEIEAAQAAIVTVMNTLSDDVSGLVFD